MSNDVIRVYQSEHSPEWFERRRLVRGIGGAYTDGPEVQDYVLVRVEQPTDGAPPQSRESHPQPVPAGVAECQETIV